MKHLCALIMAALLFSSCVDFKGNFEAEKDLIFVHSTMFGNERDRVVPAGIYDAEFGLQRFSDKMRLELKGQQAISLKLNIPSDFDIPRNGDFFLAAEETGQRYDLDVSVNTDVARSRTYHRTETCYYTVYRTRCRTVCNTRPDGTTSCRRVCSREPETRTGRRNVSYFYENTSQLLELRVLDTATAEQVGTYAGSDGDSRKVYTHRGHCQRYYY